MEMDRRNLIVGGLNMDHRRKAKRKYWLTQRGQKRLCFLQKNEGLSSYVGVHGPLEKAFLLSQESFFLYNISNVLQK